MKKNTIVTYNASAIKGMIRSVTPKDIQHCLDDMGLDFSKYNSVKACKQKQVNISKLIEVKETQKSNDFWLAF